MVTEPTPAAAFPDSTLKVPPVVPFVTVPDKRATKFVVATPAVTFISLLPYPVVVPLIIAPEVVLVNAEAPYSSRVGDVGPFKDKAKPPVVADT
jgi:hypothetical protein